MAFEKYQILDLTQAATPEEIKRAYYRLVRLHPPEKDPEKFKAIRSAYETLSDPKARAAYDSLETYGEEVNSLFGEAEALMNDQKFEDALRRFKRILVLAPEVDSARNSLGLCQMHLQDFDGASHTYYGLLQRKADVPVYWSNYGASFHEQAERSPENSEQRKVLLKKARECYRKAAELENFNPGHCLALARAYADEERLDEAVRSAEQGAGAARDGREDLDTLFYLAVLHLRRGKLDEIEPIATRVSASLPDNEEARKYAAYRFLTLASELHKLNAFHAATTFYHAARRFDPTSEEIREACDHASVLARASDEFLALKHDPQLLPAVRMLATFYVARVHDDQELADEKKREEVFQKIIDDIFQQHPISVVHSIARLRGTYPNNYLIAQETYDKIWEAAQQARQQQQPVQKSSNCFVVTATFGSPWAAEVETFRRFRDRWLSRSVSGRLLIRLYWIIGPPMARAIERAPALRRVMARVLGWVAKRLP